MPGGDYEFRDDMPFPYCSYEGMGNLNVPVSKSYRVILNNTPINYQTAIEFLINVGLEETQIIWKPSDHPDGDYPTTDECFPFRVWGHGIPLYPNGECIGIAIFRPSVWILLHELGHVLEPSSINGDFHHPTFGLAVKRLYDHWMRHFHGRIIT